jgi:hypothetical protein
MPYGVIPGQFRTDIQNHNILLGQLHIGRIHNAVLFVPAAKLHRIDAILPKQTGGNQNETKN